MYLPHLADPYRSTAAPSAFYKLIPYTRNTTDLLIEHETSNTGWPVFFLLLLMVCVICANVLMCIAIHKAPSPRFVTNILTLNLGACDLGIALACIPMSLGTMARPMDNNSPQWFCHLVSFLTMTFLLVSVGTLAAISLDRYFSICHALRYPIEMTGRRGYYVLTFIWMQSMVFASLPLFGWGEYGPDRWSMCVPQWSASISYAMVLLVLGIALPFSCMLFSYSRIIQEARKQTQRIVKLQLTPSCNVLTTFDDKDHLVPNGRRLSVLGIKMETSLKHKYCLCAVF